MTLTTDRPVRDAARPARATPTVAERPAAAPRSLTATLVLTDVYRASDGELTVGYVQVAGPVFVALLGSVYNTSVEIAQCLDLDTALGRLGAAHS